ncbi:MAG TPA: PLP-dependent aminotransferase family protein [Rubrivivax sp.]|nr:PLP-dependent aminotransferase family protein [Pseudomonadota bacterium]MCW5638732.1 PLP-dependent aminotransferase family protein [Rubrivivax sp.]HOW47073.1 PLP-dependent aminotransferase family protein [Rubrivivax sp.]HRY88336.1 PLP-dependent aminotransferase family protein [Rubrivivax sp.]HRZ62476.1 PLP-dependent aminotransferase family protein [Rubrivivax sp.]
MLVLHPQSSTPLVVQIVEGLRRLIDEGALRSGTKVPSIRQFAHAHDVSVFTVVEAYDRLVAQGLLVSRPHSGFFVRRRARGPGGTAALPPAGAAGTSFDAMWYLRKVFENRHLSMKPGCGWLPGEWLFGEGVKRALRGVAGDELDFGGYGDPKGFAPLRRRISDALAEQELGVAPEQVLLTQGSSQALDLAARRLVRPGDVVLVDDPGYANLLFGLRFLGATLVGAPRTPQGWDLAALEAAIVQHRPRVFFTQPRLQSPTGSVAQLAQLHRVLQLAEKHDLLIVENDICADLDPDPRPSLASLDQLARVLHVGSFSKTISPNLRVGYVVAHPDLVEDLAQLKMIAGLTSPELTERLANGALTEGRWRKHLKGLRERLARAHELVARRLDDLGFEIFHEPKAGLFLWARHPDMPDAGRTALEAAEHDILLGPGHLFAADLQPTPWMRFNVAYSSDERVFAFLESRRRAV